MMERFRVYLYEQRFLFFLVALLLAIFGPALFPKGATVQFNLVSNTLFYLSGINLTRKSVWLYWTVSVLFIFIFGMMLMNYHVKVQESVNSVLLGLIFILITYSLFMQIINSKEIDFGILIASFSALIVIGLVGAKLYMFVEVVHPGSFSNLSDNIMADLSYFSFVTLLTIGYGDIAPVSESARNATLLLSLVGHFYSLVIMAIIIGKYLSGKNVVRKNNSD